MKRKSGAKPTHGVYALRDQLKRKVDQRTKVADQRNGIADSIARANGGWEAMGDDQVIETWVVTDIIMVVAHAFKYVQEQPELIKNGDLIPPLGKQLLAWANAVPRHLAAIRELAVERGPDGPTIEDIQREYAERAQNQPMTGAAGETGGGGVGG